MSRLDPIYQDIAQAVLLHFWDMIERELSVVTLAQHRPEELFRLLTASSGMKPAKALQVLGGLSLIQSIGIRGLRSLMGKSSNRTWQRLKNELDHCPIPSSPKAQMMRQMRESLIEFSPTKLYGCNSQNFDEQKDVMNEWKTREDHIDTKLRR